MIIENYDFVILIAILCTIQSILGIGILVLGTPILLILNYQIIEIMFLLLPVSILTSLTNLILRKLLLNKDNFIQEKDILISFLLICLPSIFFGLFFLKYLKDLIDFNLLVSIIIISSLVIKKTQKKYFKFGNIFKKFLITIIGFIHGLTNSGGTLMTLFILNKYEGSKKNSIYEIHFFYFLLACSQFLLLFLLVDYNYRLEELNIILLASYIIIFSFIGHNINMKIRNNVFSNLIDLTALIASLVLVSKSI